AFCDGRRKVEPVRRDDEGARRRTAAIAPGPDLGHQPVPAEREVDGDRERGLTDLRAVDPPRLDPAIDLGEVDRTAVLQPDEQAGQAETTPAASSPPYASR